MTRLENIIKEVDTMKEIACDAVYEGTTTTHEYQCGRCPLYSSVHGCRFDYVLDELEYIRRK